MKHLPDGNLESKTKVFPFGPTELAKTSNFSIEIFPQPNLIAFKSSKII